MTMARRTPNPRQRELRAANDVYRQRRVMGTWHWAVLVALLAGVVIGIGIGIGMLAWRHAQRRRRAPAAAPQFTPIVRARPISGLPWESKVCASCALSRILDACAESVAEMSDEEIDAELRAEGVDVDAFAERMKAQIDALTKEKP